NATTEDINAYKEVQKQKKLSKQGSLRIKALRDNLDLTNAKEKYLLISVDGSYTNKEVLKNLPQKTILVGRIRKDTKLFKIPEENTKTGRKKIYGDAIPTPEQIRQDEKIPWERVEAWAAGKSHQ